MAKLAATDAAVGTTHLPARLRHSPRGTPRPSRRARWRLWVLIGVHLAFLAHLAHWKLNGSTLTPLEPSEAGQLVELGYVNAGLVLLALSLLATLVFGRFFCGWGCHIVALQDGCAWLLGRFGLRPRPVRSRLLVWVPVLAAVQMFLAPALLRLWRGDEWPSVTPHFSTAELWERFPGPLVSTLTFLVCGGLVVWVLGAKGFCTYGCPYGALFGAVERFAKGRIRVTDACEGCGHCSATCTSNVLVHAEVARHKMVVDPGCMKCMDCVSVCPKDALYFGFGPTAKSSAPRRQYDFSLREEALLASVFLLSGSALHLGQGVPWFGRFPLLLSIGLGLMCALASVVLLRLARGGAQWLQHHELRGQQGWSARGWCAGASCTALLALVVVSSTAGLAARRAESQLASAAAQPAHSAARRDLLEQALSNLRFASSAALSPSPTLLRSRGGIEALLGHTEPAAASLRRYAERRGEPDLLAGMALELLSDARHLLAQAANLLHTDRDAMQRVAADAGALAACAVELDESAEARYVLAQSYNWRQDLARGRGALERALTLDPDHEESRVELAKLLVSRGEFPAALEHCRALLARDPANTRVGAVFAQLLSSAPGYDDARYAAAEMVLAQGEPEQARNALGPLLARQPVPARALQLLAEIERALDE